MKAALWATIAMLPLAACSGAEGNDRGTKAPASGAGTTRSFAVADFTGVELSGRDDVDVRVGAGFSVRAEGPSDQLDKLDIRRDGATLRVGRVKEVGSFNWGGGDRGQRVKVYVTMPRIVAGSVAGSGDLAIDKVSGGDFDGAVAGSGDLVIGLLAANAADLSIAGSGGIAAKGAVQKLSASIAGSGDIDGDGLKAATADISIAGSGGVRAEVDGPASVSIMGSGDADLGANAKCKTSKMGSGSARCGG